MVEQGHPLLAIRHYPKRLVGNLHHTLSVWQFGAVGAKSIMTRDEATHRLNDFLRRHYRWRFFMPMTADDLVITRETGVWLFKQPCNGGDLCGNPHPEDMPEPVYHRVVMMDWQQKPATYEEWKVLSMGRCRVCGSSAELISETETLTFHYPQSVEPRSVIVDYAICEKCGKIRV